jgi:hypothetical protein
MEIWKDIPNFDNLYQVSNLGNIKVKDREIEKFYKVSKTVVVQKYKERFLNPHVDRDGHMRVHIGINKKNYHLLVHRLVLLTFVGEPPDGAECCHNNGIPNDNRLENLRWDTHFNNNQDRKRHGNYASGKNHPMYGKPMSEELKQKLLKLNLGKKTSQQTKEKMSIAHKLAWEKRRVSQQKTT